MRLGVGRPVGAEKFSQADLLELVRCLENGGSETQGRVEARDTDLRAPCTWPGSLSVKVSAASEGFRGSQSRAT